jgi:pimeloyl-ACP methyl ester carboxylesterase
VQRIPSTDGVEIAVHDLGGDGPPLLFAHATGLHGHCWDPVAARLDGYHAWALDFRGHGDSSKPPDLTYDWHGFADDVLAVVDALGLEQPVGVGHSKGGAALLLAEEARPGTFAALWCFDPVVFPPDLARAEGGAGDLADDNPLAAGAERRKAVFASRAEAFANYREKPPFAVTTDEALHAYVDHGFTDEPDGTVRLKCPPMVEAQVYRMGASHDAFDHLGEIGCPVTIARATTGDFGPAAFASRIADAIPDGRLADYPHLTHFGPLEAPDEMARSIADAFTPRPSG